MQAPLIAGHPAIDFLNTSFTPDGKVVETIGDGRAFLAWLVSAGLLDELGAAKLMKRLGASAIDTAAAEARALRERIRDWLLEWREKPNGDFTDELARLNRLLGRGAWRHELIQSRQGFTLLDRPTIDGTDSLLALIAKQVAALVTDIPPSLVKSCAGHKCSLWFVDRTKAHRRMFCSASACGNRAKVAAFRRRQKSA